MAIAWGVVVTALSLLCWGGQALSWLSPRTAVRLSLTEPEHAVEPAFHADARGEALWDTLTLWVTVVAGVLLVAGNPGWSYFGLAGGAVYVYFAGRGIATRRALRQRGQRIGTPQNVRSAYVFLSIWGVMGLMTVIAAAISLATSPGPVPAVASPSTVSVARPHHDVGFSGVRSHTSKNVDRSRPDTSS